MRLSGIPFTMQAPKRLAAFIIVSGLALQSCVNKTQSSALNDVAHALCEERLVLLGEGGNHGEGATTAFKAALIEKLIDSCGFNNIIFEASMYEFADISAQEQEGSVISEDRLATAVGGLWSNDREFKPLLKTLTEKLNAGHIQIAGIDDQLSGRGQSYANDDMIIELTEFLPAMIKEDCRAKFRQKIYSHLPQTEPYSKAFRTDLMSCLSAIDATSNFRTDLPVSDMIKSIERWLSREFISNPKSHLRDASMFENFAVFQLRDVPERKTIIWGATIHLSKSARSIPAFSEGPNFGELLVQHSEAKPYVLGFSAGSGAIRLPGGRIQDLEPAGAETLEGQVLSRSNVEMVFIGSEELRRFGKIGAAGFGYKTSQRNWSELLDGIVVFREQRPAIVEAR